MSYKKSKKNVYVRMIFNTARIIVSNRQFRRKITLHAKVFHQYVNCPGCYTVQLISDTVIFPRVFYLYKSSQVYGCSAGFKTNQIPPKQHGFLKQPINGLKAAEKLHTVDMSG